MVLPRLRMLKLTIQVESYSWDDSINQVFTHFSNTLEHLTFAYSPLSRQAAVDMLNRLPNLRNMSFSGRSDLAEDWDEILGALTLPSAGNGNEQSVSGPNPKLAHMRLDWSEDITDEIGTDENIALFYQAFGTMIESRWRGRLQAVNATIGGLAVPGLMSVYLSRRYMKNIEEVAPEAHAQIARCIAEG
ncbi:hypothetical protein EW146_g6706 [Bondarzewia mesenterica]|uniref:F-box domain-containing protein n=1 Tax=Bondarzewia mesenterica TaxID=1095465 RepID=A0A4S4LPN3_9AGAM|nr:hypothetical protein EW146_g6706 [Bondarzewia mesenterica]